MPRQLTFDLARRPALGRGDFFVSEANAAALAQIEAWRDWPQGKLCLVGPEGAGKTHLAQVFAGLTGASLARPGDAPAADAPAVVVEDADRLDAEAETWLFHLHNLAAERGLPLLVTGRLAPGHWRIRLPDLRSRLQAAPVAEIAPPDDALLAAVLMKQFDDRQIAASPALVAYLAARIERSFAAAARVVARLDARALAERRPVGRALAREVLADTPVSPDDDLA